MQYKNNIVERMGGVSQYEMAVFQMSERLIEDSKLRQFYGSSNVDDLFDLQMGLMELALREINEETRSKLRDRVTLQHYRLFQSGLNGSHFELIKGHLMDALQHSWVEADVIEDVLDCFEPLRKSIFENGGRRTYCGSDDEEEFEMPLKKDTVVKKESKKMQRKSSGNSIDKAPMNKGPRTLSGENLLSMLTFNRTKRAKSTSAVQ